MSKENKSLENILLASYFPLTWIQYSKEIGLPIEQLMHRCGIIESQIIEKQGVPLQKFGQLLIEVVGLTPHHEIGFEVGWRLPITAYGNLGQAILASATVEDALQICISYWGLIARGFTLDVDYSDEQCILNLNLNFPIESDLRRIVFEATLASLYRGCITLEPEIQELGEVWCEWMAPDYVNKITDRIAKIRFGMPATQIRFPRSLLKKNLPLSSPLGLQTALQRCDDELKVIGLQEKMIQKVQNVLILKENKYPTLDEIAETLNVSPRTLRRKLENENTRFSTLLDQVRQRDAMRLLDRSSVNISEISTLLGYKDVANFTRAFKKWTGMSPSAYKTSSKQQV